jgi:hypothetical protein
MFCPLCRTEYRPGFTRCADCDVDLIEALPVGQAPEVLESDLEVAWRGGDPIAYSRVVDALENAGIEFSEVAMHDHLAFGLGIPRPPYEVRVRRTDFDRAVEVISDIQESLPLQLSSRKIREGELLSDESDPEKPKT